MSKIASKWIHRCGMSSVLSQVRMGLMMVTLASAMVLGCSRAVDVAKETEILKARSTALSNAEAARDIKKALEFWAEDAIVQPAGAPQVQGLEAVSALYHQVFDGPGLKEFSSTPSNLIVSKSGDLAFEYGVNRMVFQGPKDDLLDIGKFLGVWKKVNENWYVAALSFTSDAPAPVPVPVKK